MNAALRARIEEALTRADYFRRSSFASGGQGGHKEWQHFCIYGPGIDVLVNFSVVDDVSAGARRGAELSRLTVLYRERTWDGDVELHDAGDSFVQGGALRARFGRNTLELRDGAYHVDVSLRDRPFAIRATLAPQTFPSIANNIQLDPGPPINWLVLPRLLATGVVRVGEREIRLEGAPAYHDHNWGHFAWGRDFAWEWGFGLPEDTRSPWTMVFVRLSDRAHTSARMQALFLWKGAQQHRVFRASDLRVRHDGLLRPAHVLKLPRVMGLVSPGTATDVPKRLEVRAERDGDALSCELDAEDAAQVVIPNDRDMGVTIINEVSGVVRLRGEVRGEAVSMEGHAIFEFLGA